MKTLAIRQPWITYIAEGTKPLEIRTWRTSYRGPLLLSASGKPLALEAEDGQIVTLPTQCLVCIVDLVDVRPMTPADEARAHVPHAPGLWAWELTNPRHVIPFSRHGRLSLYETEEDLAIMLPDGEHYLDNLHYR